MQTSFVKASDPCNPFKEIVNETINKFVPDVLAKLAKNQTIFWKAKNKETSVTSDIAFWKKMTSSKGEG